MRILIVEDDRKIGGFLTRGLSEEGHAVRLAADLETARDHLAADPYDLLLVDRMLPDGDGLSLVKEARHADARTMIMCLTARDNVDDRVEGLYGGADDYMTKPFAFDELLARIAALVRRRGGFEKLQVGDLSVDIEAHRVFRGTQEIDLTPREFALLRYLVENAGRVLTRTRILERVWDTMYDPGHNVVDVYISYLRKKIDQGAEKTLIHTVRGVGYVVDAGR